MNLNTILYKHGLTPRLWMWTSILFRPGRKAMFSVFFDNSGGRQTPFRKLQFIPLGNESSSRGQIEPFVISGLQIVERFYFQKFEIFGRLKIIISHSTPILLSLCKELFDSEYAMPKGLYFLLPSFE
jgi:hypothetical protein